ncbi:uncharacterized protein LOC118510005 [Anopheles stephensi]|uniref:uncharacterized protein LOC118510005 n=1 Tax=Anopheles stephensi TaxID=30069 RepID=UPI001658A33A|nr:uncharacterized protein LOC118510005 [Anopheles stephensi]
MHQLITRIWEQEELPQQWKLGVIHSVYKNARTIVLFQSSMPPIRSCPRSCSADLPPLLRISSEATKLDPPEVPRAPDAYVSPLYRLQGGPRYHRFETHKGLRQGDGLSCLLFNIVLEGVIRGAGLHNDIRGTILYRSLQFLGFADDIERGVGKTTATVCETHTRLKRKAARIGLMINATKTKYLLAGGSDRDRARVGSSVLVDSDNLEVVEEFCYLGTVVTSDNDVSSWGIVPTMAFTVC